MGTLLTPTLDIDCPVNWDWEGNRGLVGEWAVAPVPGWRGVPKVRDLTCKGRDGALTNGPAWRGADGRPGGYGSLAFDGVAAGVYLPLSTALDPSSFTYAAWVWPDAAGSGSRAVFGWDADGNPGFRVNASNQLEFLSQGVAVIGSGATALPSGQWSHGAVTYDAASGAWAIYLNGKADASGTSAQTWGFGSARRYLGRAIAQFFQGRIDGLALYSGPLQSSEVAALVAESKQGNPNRWRWVGRRTWLLGAAAPAGTKFRRTLYARVGSRGVN